MGHLVSYNTSDSAEIHSRVSFRVEHRGLQDSGRENNLVVERTVVGIDSLWRHAPFGFIHRLAHFV